jgi:hypothetical protein
MMMWSFSMWYESALEVSHVIQRLSSEAIMVNEFAGFFHPGGSYSLVRAEGAEG